MDCNSDSNKRVSRNDRVLLCLLVILSQWYYLHMVKVLLQARCGGATAEGSVGFKASLGYRVSYRSELHSKTLSQKERGKEKKSFFMLWRGYVNSDFLFSSGNRTEGLTLISQCFTNEWHHCQPHRNVYNVPWNDLTQNNKTAALKRNPKEVKARHTG